MGLKGPGAWSWGAVPVTGVAAGIGAIGVGGLDDRAADASISSPLTAAGSGERVAVRPGPRVVAASPRQWVAAASPRQKRVVAASLEPGSVEAASPDLQ